jgi:hypothetical protein
MRLISPWINPGALRLTSVITFGSYFSYHILLNIKGLFAPVFFALSFVVKAGYTSSMARFDALSELIKTLGVGRLIYFLIAPNRYPDGELTCSQEKSEDKMRGK